MSSRAILAKAISEKDFQENVRKTALLYEWRYYHTHDGRHSPEGFPDTVMAKGQRLIFAELKREGKEPTQAQQEWLDALAATGAESYCWQPSDMPEIIKILSKGAP